MKFVSKYREHRIVMTPTYKKQIGINTVIVPGKAIEFKNFEFYTKDKEEIEFLKSSSEYGSVIHSAPEKEDIKKNILKLADEIKSDKISEKPEDNKEKKPSLKCEFCGFIAKSELGLKAHMKKHEK